jgi:hypothetical protein
MTFSCLLTYKSPKPILCSNMYNYKEQCYYIIRKYVLPIWSEKQLYIFTQNNTLGIQLHVSALYIGHRQVVL